MTLRKKWPFYYTSVKLCIEKSRVDHNGEVSYFFNGHKCRLSNFSINFSINY